LILHASPHRDIEVKAEDLETKFKLKTQRATYRNICGAFLKLCNRGIEN